MNFCLSYVGDSMYFIVALFSFIVCTSGTYRDNILSIFVFIFTSVTILLSIRFGVIDKSSYVIDKEVAAIISIIAANIMLYNKSADNKNIKHSLIYLGFALVNALMAFNLRVDNNWFTYAIYSYFDELTIILCFLQLQVLKNEFTTATNGAFDRVRRLLRRWHGVGVNCG